MIVGIAGSFGAGKGAVVEYLVQKHGFIHFSASAFITEEIRARGLAVNRDTMIVIANELRHVHGPTYIVESLYERARAQKMPVVIESLRAVSEVQKIKALGGTVIGVDADPRIRYERSVARGSEKDHVTYEEWLAQEQAESNPDDPTKQDIFGSLAQSDFCIDNNGTLEELYQKIESTLAHIKK